MKKIFYAILMIVLSMPLCGYTIKGGVTYTVETARKEAFADVEYTLPKSIIEANKVDPNYQENMKAKAKGKNRLKDRRLVFFDDNSYGVIYNNNRHYAFYYSLSGALEAIDKAELSYYPVKNYGYNLNGDLESISLHVSSNESYKFNVDGTLDSYWIYDKCYDVNGRVIAKRKY